MISKLNKKQTKNNVYDTTCDDFWLPHLCYKHRLPLKNMLQAQRSNNGSFWDPLMITQKLC